MEGSPGQIDRYYDTYRRSSSYDDAMRRYTFATFRPYLEKKDAFALELGCSDGQMTEMIASCVQSLDVVDGSSRFLDEAKKRNIGNANFTLSMFSDFSPKVKYDYVFATFILTHIPDLPGFFSKVLTWMKEDGILFVAVPNARVLSRQLALHMGLLKDLFLLSENDRNHGHCRAYDRVRLNRDLDSNGFRIIHQGGVMMKPLADFQMDQLIDQAVLKQEQLDGLYKLGMEYPDLSAVLFAVCKKSNT